MFQGSQIRETSEDPDDPDVVDHLLHTTYVVSSHQGPSVKNDNTSSSNRQEIAEDDCFWYIDFGSEESTEV